VLGSVGWQQWSKFGKVEVGVDSSNPTSDTTDLDYDDTWHAALGVRGDLIGSYPDTGMFFLAFNFNWKF
jgi:long-subunit fatty acid transport protein